MAQCQNVMTPNTTNPGCSVAKGGTYRLPGFCEQAPNTGHGVTYCRLLGTGGADSEWQYNYDSGGGACNFQANGNGGTNKCTSGGVAGHGADCIRTGYAGDPLQCCINNNGNSSATQCFSDVEKKRTCAPEYRSNIASGCQDQFFAYCTASDYLTKWGVDSECSKALAANYTSTNINYASKLLGGLMTKYFQQFNPTISGDEKYNSFQTRLATLASTYPAAANSYLNNTLCTRYSRSDALNNKGILTFCGCHLPISQYDILENTGVSTFVCDSLCSNTIAIPTVQTGSLTPNICNQPVCVINDVAITLINSTTGPISINQVCNGCSGAQGSSCNCAIVNVDLQANSSQLNRIDFSQNCGNPTCYKNDSTGVLQVVDCGLSPSEQQDQANQEGQTKRQERIQQSTNRTVKIILIVLIASIVLLLLIAIIIFVLSKKKDEM